MKRMAVTGALLLATVPAMALCIETQHVAVASVSSFDAERSLRISADIRPMAASRGGLVTKVDGDGKSFGLFLLADGHLLLWIAEGQGDEERGFVRSTIALETGRLHRVQGAYVPGSMRVMVDGEDVSGPLEGRMPACVARTKTPLRIGSERDDTYQFVGCIENVVLEVDDVVVGHWPLVDNVRDSSPAGNHGVVMAHPRATP
jgi:hypothetical protein